MIQRLKTLQANKAQYPNGRVLMQSLKNDTNLRKEIETLSKQYLHRPVKGCTNCYYDAYFELLNLSIEKIMNTKPSQFNICRGVLLRDVVNLDISKNMTALNVNDQLALYHLKTNPACVKYFTLLPANWQELVEAYQIDGTSQQESQQEEENLTAEEQQLIQEIAVLLAEKRTKTSIQETYKGTTINSKKLTGVRIKQYIKLAEEAIENQE